MPGLRILPLVVLLLLVALPASLRAIEAGDTCATAGEIPGTGTYVFTIAGASADDPCSTAETVWYRFTAPQEGLLKIDTCGSSSTTLVTVWEGPECPTNCVGGIAQAFSPCNESAMYVDMEANQTIHISIGKWSGAQTLDGFLNVVFGPPRGASCDNPIVISSDGSLHFDTTNRASTAPFCRFSPTVWFRFTAPSDGDAVVDLCGSSFDTYLAVFDTVGCPTFCTPLAQNDNSCGLQSSIAFAVERNREYHIAVSGNNSSQFGPGVLNFAFSPRAGDFCQIPGVILGPGSYAFDTTSSMGLDPCGDNKPAVWFQFRPTVSGLLTADLCGSSFDTYLYAFKDGSCPLSCVGPYLVDQDDDRCGEQSRVAFYAIANRTYRFAITGSPKAIGTDANGPGIFNLAFAPSFPPGNSECSGAYELSGNGSGGFDTTASYGRDPCSPGTQGSRTIWYKYTAPSRGTMNVSLCGSSFDTVLTVFKGPNCPTSCDPQSIVATNDDACGQQSAVTFPTVAGTTYYFAVRGRWSTDYGPGNLSNLFTPSSLGDINGDRIINVADVTLLANLIKAGTPPATDVADVNEDGSVTVLDVEALATYITTLPPPTF